MTDHKHINYDSLTFEEFNKLVDESIDEGCGFCFSLNHYKHLSEVPRKMIWLGMTNQEEARIELLAQELTRLKNEPINDTIYSYILQAECMNTNSLTNHHIIATCILDRAHEMCSKKMPSAWVAVRAFDWLANLPERFLKRNVQFMTMAEAKRLTEKKFIKPADDKVFAAAVYEPGTFNPHASIPDDTPTLVSDVVQWDLEYRCFVSGTSVLTWSNYLFYGEINDPKYHHMISTEYEHPALFVQQVLQETNTYLDKSGNPIWMNKEVPGTVPSVIDVGVIRGKGMAVIESNQAWASGIYGCDPDRVLDVLQMSCSL